MNSVSFRKFVEARGNWNLKDFRERGGVGLPTYRVIVVCIRAEPVEY